MLIQPDGVSVAVRPGESLLDAMHRQARGLVPVGCKGGGCGICKVRVVEGKVMTGPQSIAVLPESDQQTGMVLACKATPLTDLVVERVDQPKPAWLRSRASSQ